MVNGGIDRQGKGAGHDESEMVNTVLDLVSTPGVLYVTVLVLLTVDAFVPVVPAQALMIGGGILSASGHVQLVLLVLSGAAGVISGDLLAFLVGRRLARRGERRRRRELPRSAARVTAWLNDAMQRHIFLAVLFCRFIPAGRMVTALYAGRNGFSTRRFASYDAVAAMLWASYGALLGHFGGEAIAESSWLPLLLIGAAALLFMAGAPLLGLAGQLRKRNAAAAAALITDAIATGDLTTGATATTDLITGATPAPRRPLRICRRRSAMETLAAVEPLAAIEVMAAAEAVAAAESVVVQVNGLESAAQ
jgi:membrane-associated protein